MPMVEAFKPEYKVDIIMPTYKRLEMFKKCYKALTENPGLEDYRISIWDNGSGKLFHDYLHQIEKDNWRVKVHYGKKNSGCKVYKIMAEKTKGEHIVFMDDDVIEFPDNWLSDLVAAYWDAPFPFKVWGMLSSNVVRDEKTNGARWPDKDESFKESNNYHELTSPEGRNFLVGSSYGGWLAITHRYVYLATQGFANRAVDKETGEEKPFFAIDGHYGKQVSDLGMVTGLYLDLEVYHAAGPWWNHELGYDDLWEAKAEETIKESAKNYLERDPTLTAMKDLL